MKNQTDSNRGFGTEWEQHEHCNHVWVFLCVCVCAYTGYIKKDFWLNFLFQNQDSREDMPHYMNLHYFLADLSVSHFLVCYAEHAHSTGI